MSSSRQLSQDQQPQPPPKNEARVQIKRGRGRGRGRGRATATREQSHSSNRSRSRSVGRKRRENLQNPSNKDQERDMVQKQNSSSDDQKDGPFELPAKTAQNKKFADAIRETFVSFFSQSNYDKGFVFTKQDRTKLRKEASRASNSRRMIQWNEEHSWDPQRELEKVNDVFRNNTLELPQSTLNSLKLIFQDSSCMFADEVTEEFYALLFQILQKAVRVQSQLQKGEVRLLMNDVLNNGSQRWKFFSFTFSKHFKLKLQKEEQEKVHQTLGEQILTILKQKL